MDEKTLDRRREKDRRIKKLCGEKNTNPYTIIIHIINICSVLKAIRQNQFNEVNYYLIFARYTLKRNIEFYRENLFNLDAQYF